MRVLICDDRKGECEAAIEEAKKGAPRGTRCEPLHTHKLEEALEEFFSVVEDVIKGKSQTKRTAFDDKDIIILDNNLTHLRTKGARLTAEAVAGYVRTFTTTPYVVSLNKNQEVDFDLRYLIGDYETRADVAINTDHLANKALWTGRASDAEDGFRPWYWPALTTAPQRRRQQISFVQKHLKKPILGSLGFPRSAIAALSRRAKGSLSPNAQYILDGADTDTSLSKVTFEDFFQSSARSLPVEEDRHDLIKMKKHRMVARAVAGELHGWIRREVLGPQDVMVDAPHLLVRMPFLAGKGASQLKAWNSVAQASRPPFGFDQSLYNQHLRRHKADLVLWLQQPAFWGRSAKDDEKLNERFFKSQKSDWGDFVFCEDRSVFEARSAKGSSGPAEFVADFESPWDRRYVSIVKPKNYVPRSRLAL